MSMTICKETQKLYQAKNKISQAALATLQEINNAGFEVYFVGGCVRDILLDRTPKDFDIATDARPQQICKIFPRAKIIGRRFQIVHVPIRNEIIEITTFRGTPKSGKNNKYITATETGQLAIDNFYGSLEEDIVRRDLTINAMYYNPVTDTFIDTMGGVEDLKNKVIRLINNPLERYSEDPVRMLRVIRFSSKLQFEVEKNTFNALFAKADEIVHIAPARLFDEVLRLVFSKDSQSVFNMLRHCNIFRYLFPQTDAVIQQKTERAQQCQKLIQIALKNTDLRIRSGKNITPAFILACLLWHPYKQKHTDTNIKNKMIMHGIADKIIKNQNTIIRIPQRFAYRVKEIYYLQSALEKPNKKKIFTLLHDKNFRAAFDFMLMRHQSGEHIQELSWWKTVEQAFFKNQFNEVEKLIKLRFNKA